MNNNIRSELIEIFEDVSSEAYTLPCKDSPCPFLDGSVSCEECWSIGEICNLFERKQTELAKQIFEEIERFLYMHFRFCKEEIGNDDTEYVKGRLELNTQMQDLIAELKKKYIGDTNAKQTEKI
jgi:hypothetical protein